MPADDDRFGASPEELRAWLARAGDWVVDYRAGIRDRPVRSPLAPAEVLARLPLEPPETAEPMADIVADFETIVLPGMTHWQHPRFFAYFPANASPASIVAELFTAGLAAQCMLWQTSPAATELETLTLDWLRQGLGLPDDLKGVIQDSASSATLAAVLTMRERALSWRGNREGLAGHAPVRVYCSAEVHSSIDKAVWIAGIGQQNLVKVPVSGARRAMDPASLEAAIVRDRADGLTPAGIVACVGGTSVGASDDIGAVADIAGRHGLYLHVDAAWAGAAMICPEFRDLWIGIERADSVVVNPHKWLGVQFDCSAHYVRAPEDLVKTLAIHPAYLETHGHDGLVNYSEWSIPLGRRFRALKLWFVLRAYGLEGLRRMIRHHVAWAGELAATIGGAQDFEIVTAPVLSLFSFRWRPAGSDDLDALNQRLLDAINDDGRIYLTQTQVDGKLVIRFQVGQFDTTRDDVMAAWSVIQDVAHRLQTND